MGGRTAFLQIRTRRDVVKPGLQRAWSMTHGGGAPAGNGTQPAGARPPPFN
jgi:hypothetical protein